MFWRILGQLFSASRGRLAVALLALASGAAVTTALINLNLDVERKVSGEFRTLGANAIILPRLRNAQRPATPDTDISNQHRAMKNSVAFAPSLMPDSVFTALSASPQGNRMISAPYLYIVASMPSVSPPQQVIVVGTRLASVAQLAPWWKIEGKLVTDINDYWRCLIGVNVARQFNLAPGSMVTLHYATPTRESTATLEVEAIISSGGQEDSQIIADFGLVQSLASLGGQMGSIALRIPGTPAEISSTIAKISAALPDAEVRPVPQIAQAEASLLPRIRGLIFFMVALILVLTTLCVFASMAALAMERRRDVGLMKAIGGSISRIVRIFFTEAAALGLAGALIGYVAGIFLSRWIGQRAFHVAISARPEVLPIVLALMVLVSLAGALPLRLLGRVRPAEILRGE